MAKSDATSSITLLEAPDHNIGDEHADRDQAQAMHIRLARDTVREMQQAARAGRQLHLNFGSRPTFQFDEHRFPLSLVKPEFRHEVYSAPATDDQDNQEATFEGLIGHRIILDLAKDTAASALAAADKLKEQMRTWQQDRDSNSSAIVNMAGRKSLNRSALSKASTTQSMPSSPAFPPARKSATDALSSGRTTEDRIEDAQRRAFLHCLAIEPLDLATIARKTRIPEKACAKFAAKYCDDSSDGLLTLDKNAYKDFDIVNLRYATAEQRVKAVDNAIHALDRMRLSRDDKLWQKLLPLEERGKGRCLSRLTLHTGPADKIPSDHRKLLAGAGGEPMARSVSSDNIAKAKKPTEREKQAKRLLSKNKASPAVSSKQPVSKTVKKIEERAGPVAKTGQKRKPEAKALSAEFVEDSDDELREPNEQKGNSRKKLKADGGAAMAAPKASRTPIIAPAKASGKLARAAVPAASSQATTTPKKMPAQTAISSSNAKPKEELSRLKSTNLATKAPAVSAKEPERKTLNAVGTSKNSPKVMPESRKVSAKASSSSLASSSTASHRSNASVSSMASSASRGSVKRPSISSQDEAPTKKQRQNAGSNSSSSSPFASSASSSSSGTAAPKSARLPELPPKRGPSAPSSLSTTKLSELQDLHSKVLSDYLQLRMKVEKQPSDSNLSAKLAQKSTEYNFLSNEVASLSQVPTSALVIPATTSFPRDSSAYFLKKYNAMLPTYNTLHAKVSAAEAPSAAQKKQLWDLYSRLDELKRLHVAADAGEQLVKRQAVIEASIHKPSEQTDEVLTRRQTLEQYKKYHQLFAAWTSFRAAQRRHPSYPHLPAATLQEDGQMYARLCALQTRLVAGFERMRRAFSRAPTGSVSVADGAGVPLSAKDAELLAWKTRSRLREWGDGYDAVFSRFGDCTAEEMDALWALQRELQSDQRAVLRSLALGFGARSEGLLDGLRLDSVTVSLGRDVSTMQHTGP